MIKNKRMINLVAIEYSINAEGQAQENESSVLTSAMAEVYALGREEMTSEIYLDYQSVLDIKVPYSQAFYKAQLDLIGHFIELGGERYNILSSSERQGRKFIEFRCFKQ